MSNEDYKQALITAIRAGGAERERAFRFFEEKLAPSFKGEGGIRFFIDFMKIVQEADPAAVEEARQRFYPLIDESHLTEKVMTEFVAVLPALVLQRAKELERKQVIANFIDGAEKAGDGQLEMFIARFLETIEPEHRVTLVAFLFRLVTSKKSPPPS